MKTGGARTMRRFGVDMAACGVRLRVEGNEPRVGRMLRLLYGHMRASRRPTGVGTTVFSLLRTGTGWRIARDGMALHEESAWSGALPRLDWLAMSEIVARNAAAAFLHAGAVADGSGGCTLVVGESGSGKSSGVLTLCRRGGGFMGDDAARLADGAALGVQRALCLSSRWAGQAGLARALIHSLPGGVKRGERVVYVPPEACGLRTVREPRPVRRVVFLDRSAGGVIPRGIGPSESMARLVANLFDRGTYMERKIEELARVVERAERWVVAGRNATALAAALNPGAA